MAPTCMCCPGPQPPSSRGTAGEERGMGWGGSPEESRERGTKERWRQSRQGRDREHLPKGAASCCEETRGSLNGIGSAPRWGMLAVRVGGRSSSPGQPSPRARRQDLWYISLEGPKAPARVRMCVSGAGQSWPHWPGAQSPNLQRGRARKVKQTRPHMHRRPLRPAQPPQVRETPAQHPCFISILAAPHPTFLGYWVSICLPEQSSL